VIFAYCTETVLFGTLHLLVANSTEGIITDVGQLVKLVPPDVRF